MFYVPSHAWMGRGILIPNVPHANGQDHITPIKLPGLTLRLLKMLISY